MTLDFERRIEELYLENYFSLRMYACSLLQNALLAEDIVQDAFCEVMKKRELLDDHPALLLWLIKTVRYKAANCQRRCGRELRSMVAYDDDRGVSLLIRGMEDRVLQGLEAESEQQVLERVREILSPTEYYLLVRLTLEKASHREVAEELGITVLASEQRLSRIRKKLKKYFGR